jgi:hypothetical protein
MPANGGMSSDRPKLQREAKSSAGEARLSSGLSGTHDPSSSTVVRALEPKEIKLLME